MTPVGDDARLAYLKQMTDGASQSDLLMMLLDGALRFINIAETAFSEKQWDVVHVNLCKVQDIFHELMLTLDSNLGEQGLKLNDIYGFINNQLIQANIDQDYDAFKSGKALILDVKKMWEDAIEKSQGENGEAGLQENINKPEETPKSINIRG